MGKFVYITTSSQHGGSSQKVSMCEWQRHPLIAWPKKSVKSVQLERSALSQGASSMRN